MLTSHWRNETSFSCGKPGDLERTELSGWSDLCKITSTFWCHRSEIVSLQNIVQFESAIRALSSPTLRSSVSPTCGQRPQCCWDCLPANSGLQAGMLGWWGSWYTSSINRPLLYKGRWILPLPACLYRIQLLYHPTSWGYDKTKWKLCSFLGLLWVSEHLCAFWRHL